MGPPGPNVLSGVVAAGTIIANLTRSTCTAEVSQGVGLVDCLVDKQTDPANPYVIAQFVCPPGQTAMQQGCIGTGPEAVLTALVQDVDIVQCFYRVPVTATVYGISVTTTCVELEIVGPTGQALVASALRAKEFSFANLRARLLG